MNTPTPFERAVQIAGNKAKLAKAIGVSPQAISAWDEARIPPEQCGPIELFTSNRVRAEALRPDLEWLRNTDGTVRGHVVPTRQVAA